MAVLIIPPAHSDDWDAYEPLWSGKGDPSQQGLDKAFFQKLLAAMSGGFGSGGSRNSRNSRGSAALGALEQLDNRRVFLQGWSAGAQRVSLLIEATMRGELNMTVAGGAWLSGGSQLCYNRYIRIPPGSSLSNPCC